MHWVERYRLADREYRVRIRADSPLVGESIGALDLPAKIGARILLIERGAGRARQLLPRTPETCLMAGEILLIDLDDDRLDVATVAEQYAVDLMPRSGAYFTDQARSVGMMEIMIPDASEFVGKTLAETEAMMQSDLTVVGLRRGRKALKPRRLRKKTLRSGDILLLAGSWKTIRRLQKAEHELIVLNLPKEYDEIVPAADKAPFALQLYRLHPRRAALDADRHGGQRVAGAAVVAA
jgi:uncharacterized protein with PhoU and TrkA domain